MIKPIVTAVLTICFITVCGILISDPPSFLDALSSATKKEVTQSDDDMFIIGVSKYHDGVVFDENGIKGKMTVSLSEENDISPLLSDGEDIVFKKYPDIMFRSRLISGKYDVFVISEKYIDIEIVKNLGQYKKISRSEIGKLL
ncbi:MAG TPA: hypothetical protein DCG28_06630 [Lachnospiraceae bacterium]|nr:hypothetical protein [Lachnospiraceae bacterium]